MLILSKKENELNKPIYLKDSQIKNSFNLIDVAEEP